MLLGFGGGLLRRTDRRRNFFGADLEWASMGREEMQASGAWMACGSEDKDELDDELEEEELNLTGGLSNYFFASIDPFWSR